MKRIITSELADLDLPHHAPRPGGAPPLARGPARALGRRAALGAAAALGGAAALALARRVAAQSAACAPVSRTPIEGPYFLGEPEEKYDTGDGLVVRGRVTTPDCAPLAGATVVRWHANRHGVYEEYFRATMRADADGRFEFSTIKPGKYANLARHVHWHVSAPGYQPLLAQLQWADGEAIAGEATFDFALVAAGGGAP
jgi:protocatechuate 3,4-dioxygenase beta subunit